MKHVLASFALLLLVSGGACETASAAQGADLTGTVHDLRGTPQMGALIEVLGPGAAVIARTFTDDHGRYLLRSIVPGNYQLRASSACLLPLLRRNLHLSGGTRSVANLTMTAVFQVGLWLPAERRDLTEPADDWKWSLRSAANRPLLRLVTDDAGNVYSSSVEQASRNARTETHLSVTSGDGAFARGGTHQSVALERSAGQENSRIDADFGDISSGENSPSLAVAASVARKGPIGTKNQILLDVESHPELGTAGVRGLQIARLASTETFALGDTVLIDAGTLITGAKLDRAQVSTTPYIQVSVELPNSIALTYAYASAREFQRSDDLDRLRSNVTAVLGAGGSLTNKGAHHEVAVEYRGERSRARVTLYRDHLQAEGLQGGGPVEATNPASLGLLTDASTGLFRVALPSHSAEGITIAWDQAISPAISACLEGQFGSALEANQPVMRIGDLQGNLVVRMMPAARALVRTDIKRTRTRALVEYRWQPEPALSQVDAYETSFDEAYLAFSVKQRLWAGRRLQGVEAVMNGSNLLAQGYRNLAQDEGHVIFLTQVPRSIQGGLQFTF